MKKFLLPPHTCVNFQIQNSEYDANYGAGPGRSIRIINELLRGVPKTQMPLEIDDIQPGSQSSRSSSGSRLSRLIKNTRASNQAAPPPTLAYSRSEYIVAPEEPQTTRITHTL
ncbi:hypothetical protein ACLKA6_008655 [Drosophila palustris]